jgi:hypothetical protein
MNEIQTKKPKKQRKNNGKLLGIIFTIVGALIFYFWGWPPLKYGWESKSWPKTSGTITNSEVNSWTKDGRSQYDARINYSYEVDGKKYNSTKINTSGSYSGGNITKAKELVDEFSAGKTIDVYYDPEIPDSAALKPGVSGNDILMAAFPLLFLIIGLAVLTGLVKPQRSTRQSNIHRKTDVSKVIRNVMNR